MQKDGDFEEDEVVVLLETPTPSPTPTPEPPTPTPTETPTPSPTPEPPTPTPEETPTPTPTPTPEETPTPTPTPISVKRPFEKQVKKEDDNVLSTPMYDTSETPESSTRGPYYVPWKPSSMEAHDKYFAKKIYKNSKGYIPNSTLGNIPTDDKSND